MGEDGLYDKEPKGTPLYMAPEVMRKEEITPKVDVYSIGIITWELLTREDPNARPTCAEVINLLDKSIEDCAGLDFERQVEKLIKDKNGRNFWKKRFPSRLTVGWREFVKSLFEEIGATLPSDPQVKPLSVDSTKSDLMKAGRD